MKTLNTRWRLIALVPLVAIAILSVGNTTGVVADQNKEVREAANEVGILIQGGITQAQVHLVLPDDQLFSDQQSSARASVMLTTG